MQMELYPDSSIRYSIDTSSILDGWRRYYPIDVFPTLWNNLEELIRKGDMKASVEVRYELAKKDDAVHAWLKEHDGFYVPIDNRIQREVSGILKQYPRLIDTRRGRSGADPFVIALAKINECAVVTGELASGRLDRPKIPDVCDAVGVECLNLLKLIRREGWVFSFDE